MTGYDKVNLVRPFTYFYNRKINDIPVTGKYVFKSLYTYRLDDIARSACVVIGCTVSSIKGNINITTEHKHKNCNISRWYISSYTPVRHVHLDVVCGISSVTGKISIIAQMHYSRKEDMARVINDNIR